MLKIENAEVFGWEHAIRGMRNPMNSWEKSDSEFITADGYHHDIMGNYGPWYGETGWSENRIGRNDEVLMNKLAKAGTDHRKFMRMITVYLDITAPLYWWKEFDTYKVGTVANSCSTMHKIAEKEFTIDDFSHEHLFDVKSDEHYPKIGGIACTSTGVLKHVITALNYYREYYLSMIKQKVPGSDKRAKELWWQMIQLLPSSYNQKRTVMLNYEVLANIYKSRRNHKLDEWHTLCDWIERLPYSELITGKEAGINSEIIEKLVDCGNGYPFSPKELRDLMKGESND